MIKIKKICPFSLPYLQNNFTRMTPKLPNILHSYARILSFVRHVIRYRWNDSIPRSMYAQRISLYFSQRRWMRPPVYRTEAMNVDDEERCIRVFGPCHIRSWSVRDTILTLRGLLSLVRRFEEGRARLLEGIPRAFSSDAWNFVLCFPGIVSRGLLRLGIV